MSHVLRKVNLGNTALVQCTIVDYVAGGEGFTLAELGLTGGVVAVSILELQGPEAFNIPPSSGVFPAFINNKVVLKDSNSSAEIPSTTGVNYLFFCIVQGT